MKDRYLKLTTSFITKYHTYDDDELDNIMKATDKIISKGKNDIDETL
mgnify:CR=1 FL=1